MNVVVVSNPRAVINEFETINNLFHSGLEIFHLRKPGFTKEQYISFLKNIPPHFLNRIVIHDHFDLAVKYDLRGIHLSGKKRRSTLVNNLRLKYLKYKKPDLKISATMHSLHSFLTYSSDYEYVFLLPAFDAISDKRCKSPFKTEDLRLINSNPEYKVIAMGGIEEERIPLAKELGFNGVALLGAIWRANDPLEIFNNVTLNTRELKPAC